MSVKPSTGFGQGKALSLLRTFAQSMCMANITIKNYDIAVAMSSSRADPVLGHYPSWEYLNI